MPVAMKEVGGTADATVSSLEGEGLVMQLKAAAPGWSLPNFATSHLAMVLKKMMNARAAAPMRD